MKSRAALIATALLGVVLPLASGGANAVNNFTAVDFFVETPTLNSLGFE